MILVVGATGSLGGMIARWLLEQGQPVRILARPQSNYQPLVAAGAEVIFGDLKDPASLDAALSGIDVVVTTANSAMRGGSDNVQTIEHEGNRNLIDAARRANVRQFIFISALGASPDHPSEFMQGKAMTDQYLRNSGVPFTILAPNVFMEVWIGMVVAAPLQSGQPVRIVGEGTRRHSFVSMADVAAFAVAAAGHPSAINQYIPIGGPAAVSWIEIVAAVSQVIGREVPIQHVSADALPPGTPPVVAALLAAMDTFDSAIDMTETARRFGVTQTPVETFIRHTFASAAS